ESEYFGVNCLIILILGLHSFFYKLFSAQKITSTDNRRIQSLKITRPLSSLQSVILVLLSVASFLGVYYANDYNLLSMLFRGGLLKDESPIESGAVSLIFNQTIRPLSMLCLLYYLC